MIVRIAGTNGSGKSFTVRQLIERLNLEPVWGEIKERNGYASASRKIIGYRGSDIWVVGRYTTPTGGCDNYQIIGLVDSMVTDAARQGYTVIFEGVRVSSSLPRWQALKQNLGLPWVWAYMATPAETCIQNIMSRQKTALRNNGRPRKYDAVRALWSMCQRHIRQLQDAGEHVELIGSEDPAGQILRILGAR